jgi:uncharacterized membrane protein YhaH (DUF805 family)
LDIFYLLTSFKGRIGRKHFWLASMYMMGLQLLFFAVASCFVELAFGLGELAIDRIDIVLRLVSTVPIFALLAKRLHDRDHPAYFVGFPSLPTLVSVFAIHFVVPEKILHVIPLGTGPITAVISLWLFVELAFLRGTIGSNQYGPDPLALENPIASSAKLAAPWSAANPPYALTSPPPPRPHRRNCAGPGAVR